MLAPDERGHYNSYELSLRESLKEQSPRVTWATYPGSEIPTHQWSFPISNHNTWSFEQLLCIYLSLQAHSAGSHNQVQTTFCLPATKTAPTSPTPEGDGSHFHDRCVCSAAFSFNCALWCACFHQGFAEAYNIKKHTSNRHVSETPKTSEQNSSHRKGKMFQRVGSMT